MKKNTIVGIVIAIIIILLLVVWANKKSTMPDEQGASQASDTTAGTDNDTAAAPSVTEAGIRTEVLAFGQKAKLVSTLAADYQSQVQLQYGTYVTPALLAKWKADPTTAFAKNTKDLTPDRIEISSVAKIDADTYKVMGTVILVSPDSAKTASSYPVTITVENQRGAWLITGVTK